MKTVELGSVIAERRLRVMGQPELDVRLRIGAPRPFPDDPQANYYCPYQIGGLGSAKVRYTGGVDAVQALELAILILPTELDALRQKYPGLGWVDGPKVTLASRGLSLPTRRMVLPGTTTSEGATMLSNKKMQRASRRLEWRLAADLGVRRTRCVRG